MTRVHKNLHKDCWARIRKGCQTDYPGSVVLMGCTFHVSEPGRQKVIAAKCRSVHAYIKGEEFAAEGLCSSLKWRAISYNPFKAGHFYYCDDGQAVTAATFVRFDNNGECLAANW